jgi:malonate-semialdehyde dehydrogenase (acetylating)/methylmalonate-semialdehyde dehydrogenase
MDGVRVETMRNFVDGSWVASRATATLPVLDPATGELLAHVPLSPPEEVRAAVAAARRAFGAWRRVSLLERVEVLFRLKHLLDEHREALAESVSLENGKALDEARGEVRRGIEVVELACAAPTVLQGRLLAEVGHGVDTFLYRVPVGVVAGITPFNFPAMIPLWMEPIAIVSGNTFVHKPSEKVPRTAALLASLWQQAGLPDGVLNVVHGDGAAVEALLTDPEVAAVSFVGSQPVAEHVYTTAAAHGKRVQALGGAKNFLVVLPDADLEEAARAITASAFGSAGQRCLAGSVLVPVGGVGEALLPLLVARARELRLTEGGARERDLGPVIRPEARRRLVDAIARGIEEGAEARLDGRVDSPTGFFLRPTILTGVRPDSPLAREELFGPVLAVVEASDLDEAIALANRSRFGNAAAIFTRSAAAARRFQQEIEAGMVGVNIGVPAPVAWFPFAGWKKSFYGDLHATGEDAFTFYTERQVVTVRW